ncbi:MAG: site-2 protease family protein [Clostridia bacterium]|nr:site-2 protease family protein [Clostridia bacterium]
MKLRFSRMNIEIENIFLIVLFLFLFSYTIRNILFSFYMCYLFIIFHELAHLTVALLFGKEIENFKFSISGVCIEFKKKRFYVNETVKLKIENIKEILLYMVGPLSNIMLACLFSNNKMIFEINMIFAMINMFPIFPLDGYHILDNILEFFNMKQKKRETVLYILSKCLLSFLLLVGIIQLVFLFNPSIIIFVFYVFLIQENNKKRQKVANYGNY